MLRRIPKPRCVGVRPDEMIRVTYRLEGNGVKDKVIVENLRDFFDDPPIDLKDIVEIDLARNALTALPPEIGKCVNLETINCSHNNLESLPQELGECINLKAINCSYNRLENLPPEIIGECVRLKTINCSDNRLENLPPEIGKCLFLEHLICSKNRLKALPSEIGKCFRLRYLSFGENPFSDDEHIGRMASILPVFFGNIDGAAGEFMRGDWKDVRKRVLTPLINQYPNLHREEIESLYPNVSFELIKMYIETGEIQTTDLPRQKSASKV